MTDLTVIILTKDEEKHIARAIKSALNVTNSIKVIDSGSTDSTIEIAERLGAEVFYKEFESHSSQFNWALEQVPKSTKWIFRLDADEIISDSLASSINKLIASAPPDIAGGIVSRQVVFLGKKIKWGGTFPIESTRLFRLNRGRAENRLMDEHLIVDGALVKLDGEITDHNLQPLSWWINKHNGYSSRESAEILLAEFQNAALHAFRDNNATTGNSQRLRKSIYRKLPHGHRAILYFLYRYIIRLGFLDGREGVSFHLLQGFWYRYLVDTKVYEAKKLMKEDGVELVEAIRLSLGDDIANLAYKRDPITARKRFLPQEPQTNRSPH